MKKNFITYIFFRCRILLMITYRQRYMPIKYVYGFSEGRNAKNRQKTGCSGLEVEFLIFRFELSLTTNL